MDLPVFGFSVPLNPPNDKKKLNRNYSNKDAVILTPFENQCTCPISNKVGCSSFIYTRFLIYLKQ